MYFSSYIINLEIIYQTSFFLPHFRRTIIHALQIPPGYIYYMVRHM